MVIAWNSQRVKCFNNTLDSMLMSTIQLPLIQAVSAISHPAPRMKVFPALCLFHEPFVRVVEEMVCDGVSGDGH